MSDEIPFYAPNHPPTEPRQPQPGELFAEFLVGQASWRIELRDHGAHGVEAQFLSGGELAYSRRFDSRAQAVQWAEIERMFLETDAARLNRSY